MTGYTGFLGKALCEVLNVEHNIFHIPSKNINRLNEISINQNQSIFIHMGWGGASNNKDLNSSIQIENIKQSIDLFYFALNLGVTHFFFVSTSWVYGKYSKICNENDLCEPKNLYGFSKLKVEEIWQELCNKNNMKLTIIRPFWIFGEGDKENRFIPTIINKCLKNEKIELNKCNHFVNYLHVSQFCSAFKILVDKQAEGIYNICNDFPNKVEFIIKQIAEITNSSSNITFNKPYSSDFINCWDGDNTKLKCFDWKNKLTLTEGLNQTIKWHLLKIK